MRLNSMRAWYSCFFLVSMFAKGISVVSSMSLQPMGQIICYTELHIHRPSMGLSHETNRMSHCRRAGRQDMAFGTLSMLLEVNDSHITIYFVTFVTSVCVKCTCNCIWVCGVYDEGILYGFVTLHVYVALYIRLACGLLSRHVVYWHGMLLSGMACGVLAWHVVYWHGMWPTGMACGLLAWHVAY